MSDVFAGSIENASANFLLTPHFVAMSVILSQSQEGWGLPTLRMGWVPLSKTWLK
jgi:hypothetical protein